MRVAKAILAAGFAAGMAVGLSAGLSAGCTAPLEGLRCPCAAGYQCDAFRDRCFLLSDGGIPDASGYEDSSVQPDGSPIDADTRTPDASGPLPDAGPDDSDASPDPDGGGPDSGPPDAG